MNNRITVTVTTTTKKQKTNHLDHKLWAHNQNSYQYILQLSEELIFFNQNKLFSNCFQNQMPSTGSCCFCKCVCVSVCMFWKISTLDPTVLVVSCFATSLVLLSATDLQVTHIHNEQWHHPSTGFPATKIAWAARAGRVADGSPGKQNTYATEAVIAPHGLTTNGIPSKRKGKKIEATWSSVPRPLWNELKQWQGWCRRRNKALRENRT